MKRSREKCKDVFASLQTTGAFLICLDVLGTCRIRKDPTSPVCWEGCPWVGVLRWGESKRRSWSGGRLQYKPGRGGALLDCRWTLELRQAH